MKRKVLITKAPLPKAQQGLYTKEKLTNNAFQFPVTFKEGMEPGFEVNKYLGPVDRDKANIEAEKGETIITPLGDDAWTKTLPKTYVIGGKKHSKGGTPLDVPEGSFIFSDHLKERNQKIHQMLGKAAKKSGYTYAELSKPFMLNDDIKVLLDPDSDRITRETAELNIKNKVDKLGMIALLQEASKGFADDEGNVEIPSVAMPYIEKTGIDIDAAIQPFLEAIKQPVQQQGMPGMDMGMQGMPMPNQGMPEAVPQMQRNGGLVKMKAGGSVPTYQRGGRSKLKPGESVRMNPQSGKYEIVNTQGIVVGYINFPSDRSATITRPKVPANAVVISRKEYDADPQAAFAAAGNKPLVIKNDDGTYRTVKAQSALPKYEEADLATVFAGQAEIAGKYGYLAQQFNDDELKKELTRRAVAALGDSDKVGVSLTRAEREQLKKKLEADPDYAYKLFMDMQKRNLGTYANQVAGKIKPIKSHKDAADPGSVSNTDFMESWAAIGLEAPTAEEAKLQQALYHGYASMIQDKAKLPLSLQQKLKAFDVGQVGAADAADTPTVGFGKGKISIVDGKYTNTTTGQIAYIKDPLDYKEGELGTENEPMTPGVSDEEYAMQNMQKGWTAPNIYELYRTMGEIYGDVPQTPWMAAPATYLPRVFLQSPEDMQRNLRGMSLAQGEQLMASGMGPAAMAALTNLSAADQVAQYTAQVDNINRTALTQASQDRGNRIERMFQNFANVANTVHNQWSQLKDNIQARRSAAKAEFSKAFQAGEQTEMDLQALQLMYPNYRLDPYSMDYKGFIPSGDITPTAGSPTSITDRALDIQASRPNMTYAEALSYAKAEAGVDDNADLLNAISRLQVP